MRIENKDAKISGAYIRKLRENRGLTIKELADKTGVNRSGLSQYECGDTRALSVSKVVAVYAYLMTLPKAEVPKPTKKSGPKTQKHRRAKVATTPAVHETEPTPETEAKAEPQAEPSKSEVKKMYEASKPVIRSVHDLLRETSIRALRESLALIDQLDNEELPPFVRTVRVLDLIKLADFISEHREVWK